MPRRNWKCFRVLTAKGYQKKRSRSHRKEFVRGGADSKIRLYDIGMRNRPTTDYEICVGMITKRSRRISHFTLEAIRITVTRRLQDALGKEGFHLRVRIHPYDTYREHAMMAFAGADRLSSGMRKSFGRPVGRCARVAAGQLLMEVGCDLKAITVVKEAFRVASNKVTGAARTVLVGTKTPELVAKVPLPYIKNFVCQYGESK